MKCSICGGTKASGYVQRLIAEGKLDPSKVSNPSVFITNLGKAHQKRINETASKNKHEMKGPKFYAYTGDSKSWSIYKLESIEPPVLNSVYTESHVLNGDVYNVTLKKNKKGKILREVKYIPEDDIFLTFASRGIRKGNSTQILRHYIPSEEELDFLNGNKETIEYTTSNIFGDVKKKEKKPVVKKEVKILTTAELEKKDKAKEKRIDKKWKDEINKKKKEREDLEQRAPTNKYAKEVLELLKKLDNFNLEETGNIYGVSRPLV